MDTVEHALCTKIIANNGHFVRSELSGIFCLQLPEGGLCVGFTKLSRARGGAARGELPEGRPRPSGYMRDLNDVPLAWRRKQIVHALDQWASVAREHVRQENGLEREDASLNRRDLTLNQSRRSEEIATCPCLSAACSYSTRGVRHQ